MNMTLKEAKYYRGIIEKAMQSIDDTEALTAVTLFPIWQSDKSYKVGDRVKYDGVLYRCLTEHAAQADWNPVGAASLWAKVLIPDENVIPEWEQPDSTNPYMIGDKVSYQGKIYECLIDNNIWSPVDYTFGWAVVEEV